MTGAGQVAHRVTAVVVNYHGVTDTIQAVQSILSDAPQAGVVVVDNGSTEHEAELLHAALAGVAEVLSPTANLGFGGGCNLAATHRPADFYWLVNPDVRVNAPCLHVLLDAMDADPQLGAVAPVQWLDGLRQWQMSPAWSPSPLSVWVRRMALATHRARHRFAGAVMSESRRLWSGVAGGLLRQRMLSGAALLVRHTALVPQGQLFDPQFFMYFEDTDLCLGLRKRGWHLGVHTDAGVVHHWRMAPHKNACMEKSAPLFMAKHFSGSRYADRAVGVPEPIRDWIEWPRATALTLPGDFHAGWMLELSPLPEFLPSIGRCGAGAVAPWPEVTRQLAPGVQWYARFSSGSLDGAFPVLECVLR